jgi:hypothetical protein
MAQVTPTFSAASLKHWIVCGCGVEHTDAARTLALLCVRISSHIPTWLVETGHETIAAAVVVVVVGTYRVVGTDR